MEILIGLGIAFLAILFGGWVLQLAIKIVAKFHVSIITCILYMFLIGIVGGLISGGLSAVLPPEIGGLAGMVINFLIGSALLGALIKSEEGEQLGFVRGMLVLLVNYLIMIVVCCVPMFFIGLTAGFGAAFFG